MGVQAFQLSSTVVGLAIALWMYSQRLRRRERFAERAALSALLATVAACGAYELGFTLYPPLTDNASFVMAILSFLGVLGFMVVTVAFCWHATLSTALFCSSSAYLLQNLALGLDRLVHFLRIVPVGAGSVGEPALALTDVASLWGSTALVYALFYLLLARGLRRRGLTDIHNPLMLFAVVVAMLVSIIFDLAIKDLAVFDVPWRYAVVLALVHLAVCAFILGAEFEIIYNQALQTSVATMEAAMAEQQRQFELSSRTIDAINRRVHDIRHQVLNTLASEEGGGLNREQLRAIAHEVDVYDAAVRTGNAALDVVVTEKGLLCEHAGITLTCVADGHALDFMAAADLYTLFGTALEGALKAVQMTEGDERRAISLNVRERMGMAAVSVEHYLPKGAEEARELGGLMLETMRAVVSRYDGSFTANAVDDIFHLDLLIPRP